MKKADREVWLPIISASVSGLTMGRDGLGVSAVLPNLPAAGEAARADFADEQLVGSSIPRCGCSDQAGYVMHQIENLVAFSAVCIAPFVWTARIIHRHV